jgi:hypothetical protein
LSVQTQYSRFWTISNSFRYDSLVTWTVVCLTAAKFKPLILSCLFQTNSPRYMFPVRSAQETFLHYWVFSRCWGTRCQQSCSLARAVLLSPVYSAVAWQLVHMLDDLIWFKWIWRVAFSGPAVFSPQIQKRYKLQRLLETLRVRVLGRNTGNPGREFPWFSFASGNKCRERNPHHVPVAVFRNFGASLTYPCGGKLTPPPLSNKSLRAAKRERVTEGTRESQ